MFGDEICTFECSKVKVNCMFINCPKIDFKHPLDRMGGHVVRVFLAKTPLQLLVPTCRCPCDSEFREAKSARDSVIQSGKGTTVQLSPGFHVHCM